MAVKSGPKPADVVSTPAGDAAGAGPDFVTAVATIGMIAAGVALFEVALIPGMLIGGAAVLAPRYVPKLRRHLRPVFKSADRRRTEPALRLPDRPDAKVPVAAPAGFGIKQAIAKTITFRIIVTTLDFTSNYVVIGELATAAGLSTFNLVVGPLFYLAHETAWNYFGPSEIAVEVPVLPRGRRNATAPVADWGRFTISRALAKTITFRTIATAMDFTATYIVVGDIATAVGLSAFGFVLGPFVYLGHEMAWDYYGSPGARSPDPPTPVNLLPAQPSSASSVLAG
jgi:uncharacterized membrane protein